MIRSMREMLCIVIALAMTAGVFMPPQVRAEETSEEELLFGEIPVVIVATKKLEKVSDVPSTIYVVEKSDIHRYGLRDLKDIMWLFPGMELSFQDNWLIGGHRGYTGAMNGTLLMVNGRDYTNMIAGEPFIAYQYGAHDIERVELLQGPASSLYGTQAMEGVINVVTNMEAKKGKDFSDVSAMQGDFNTREFSGSFGRSYRDGWIGFSARSYNASGYDHSQWAGSKEFAGSPAAIRFGPQEPQYTWNPSRVCNNTDMYVSYKDFYAGGGYYRNENRCNQEYTNYPANMQIDRRYNSLIYGGYAVNKDDFGIRFDAEYRSEETANSYPSNFVQYVPGLTDGTTHYRQSFWGMPDSNRLKLNLEGNYQKADHTLIAGLEYAKSESGDSDDDAWGFYLPTKQYYASFHLAGTTNLLKDELTSLYALDKWNVGGSERLLVYLGGRFDQSKHTPNVLTPRAGVIWHPDPVSTIKVIYGKGYRTANIWERSSQLSAIGTTEIEPRVMETAEIDLARSFGKYLQANLNIYNNNGQIYTQKWNASANAFEQATAGKKTQGFEVQAKYKIVESLGGFVNYSYTKPESTPVNGTEIDNLEIAPNKVQAGVFYSVLDSVGVSLFARWVDAMNVQANDPATGLDTISKLDGYVQTDLTVYGKDFDLGNNTKLQFSAGAKNVLDNLYYYNNPRGSSPTKFEAAGRELFAMTSLQF